MKLSCKSFSSIFVLGLLVFVPVSLVFAQEVSSPNFKIRGDSISTGSGNSSSTSFSITGEINPFSDLADSPSFRQELGYNPRIQAFTPYAPLLDNTTTTYYDRLTLTVNPSGNPSDTLFAIAISSDDFVNVYYVQNDHTIATTLGVEDYQTYDDWGGASGFEILGLTPGTAYKARTKALNGDFTETGWSPDSAEVETIVPYINLTVSENQVNFGVLSASSISQTSTVTININTNAVSGYQSYINGTGNTSQGGLYNGSDIILSASTVLSPGTAGYGAQSTSSTASLDPKYDVSGNTVGSVDVSPSPLSASTGTVANETTDVMFKATMSPTTVAGEYSDTVYFTVSPII